MREKGSVIGLIIIISILSSPIVSNSHGFNDNFEISITSDSEQLTYGDFFGLLTDQINDFWFGNDDYDNLQFYTAACDIGTNAPYWPNNSDCSRTCLLCNGQGLLVTHSETITNGSLVLFPESYLLLPDYSLPSYQLFGSVAVLNESDSLHSFYFSEGISSVGTLEKYINASLNTLFIREIDGSIVAGLYGVEPYSHAAILNLRDSLKWLDHSFNTTLLEEVVKEEINELIGYEFSNWLTKTSFGLLCLDAGDYFTNSTLTSTGLALLGEIYSSDDYLDDTDDFGWKYDLALELVNHNKTFAKEITDFCISLFFDDLGEEFLQPLVASTERYLFLSGNPGNCYTTNLHHYSLVSLLLNMHAEYPLENYNSTMQKIMNYFFTLLYYDPINDIYNPDISLNYTLSETLSYSTLTSEFRNGFIYQFTRIISQLLDGLDSINDSTPPTVEISQDYWLIEGTNYSVNHFEMIDTLTGVNHFEIRNETHQLETIYQYPSLTDPFYFPEHTSHNRRKLDYDSIHCYCFFTQEMLQSEPTRSFIVYDKIGNWGNVTITFDPNTTPGAGISIKQMMLFLPVTIALVIFKKRTSKIRKNSE